MTHSQLPEVKQPKPTTKTVYIPNDEVWNHYRKEGLDFFIKYFREDCVSIYDLAFSKHINIEDFVYFLQEFDYVVDNVEIMHDMNSSNVGFVKELVEKIKNKIIEMYLIIGFEFDPNMELLHFITEDPEFNNNIHLVAIRQICMHN